MVADVSDKPATSISRT